jgi:hypothetical protein
LTFVHVPQTAAERSTARVRDQVEELLTFFDYSQLPPHLQPRSQPFHELAVELTRGTIWSFELVACLRALLIAKDAGVRAYVYDCRLRASPG